LRRAARVDGNQSEIVAALRAVGASVTPTHAIGGGFPDLVVGFRKRSILFEVKDPAQPPSKRRLTDDEAIWFGNWRGEAHVIETAEQAIAILMGEKA
jgi:hypothetical protein